MFLEALRRNEGFCRDTDTAFAKFWEREGDSLKKREFHEMDADGNTTSITILGDFIKKPDSDPHVLDAYYYSPEAHYVRQKYGLYYPFHYNQERHGQQTIISPINANGFAGTIDGQTVWIFRYPCLQGFRDQSLSHLDIRIELTWPKEAIINTINMVLDEALQERERAGNKIRKRGLGVDSFPFRVWDMHKEEGKSPWEITQELNPGLKTLTAKGCTRKKCLEKIEFQTLTDKKKATYNNKFCGKKDSCLIAKAFLKNVRDAIAKAESQIASVSPIK